MNRDRDFRDRKPCDSITASSVQGVPLPITMHAHVNYLPFFFTSRMSYRLLPMRDSRIILFVHATPAQRIISDIDCQRQYATWVIITTNCNNVPKERLADFGDYKCLRTEGKKVDRRA